MYTLQNTIRVFAIPVDVNTPDGYESVMLMQGMRPLRATLNLLVEFNDSGGTASDYTIGLGKPGSANAYAADVNVGTGSGVGPASMPLLDIDLLEAGQVLVINIGSSNDNATVGEAEIIIEYVSPLH